MRAPSRPVKRTRLPRSRSSLTPIRCPSSVSASQGSCPERVERQSVSRNSAIGHPEPTRAALGSASVGRGGAGHLQGHQVQVGAEGAAEVAAPGGGLAPGLEVGQEEEARPDQHGDQGCAAGGRADPRGQAQRRRGHHDEQEADEEDGQLAAQDCLERSGRSGRGPAAGWCRRCPAAPATRPRPGRATPAPGPAIHRWRGGACRALHALGRPGSRSVPAAPAVRV